MIRSVVVFLTVLALVRSPAYANGGDLPSQILLSGFMKPDADRLHFVLRIPLVLLHSLDLPKRGPGYLDLARTDARLTEAAAAAARDIALFEDGRRLAPSRNWTRISRASDRSFGDYATAVAHIHGPPLPVDTDVFWNDGYFDVHFEYPIRADTSDFAIHMGIEPGLGRRIKLRVQFLPGSGPSRTYELPGGSGRLSLSPRWHEAARLFLLRGALGVLTADRVVLLLCLVAPFRRVWGVLAPVMVFTAMQALTSLAPLPVTVEAASWLPPLSDTCTAAAVVLVAIENIVAPSLQRRWFIAAMTGVFSGFGFARGFAGARELAGEHARISLVSFNLGIAIGMIAATLLAFGVLTVLSRYVLGARLGVVLVSVLLAHTGWHWAMDAGHRLQHALDTGVTTASVVRVGCWLLLGVLVGGGAWFLPERFAPAPVPPLRSLLRADDL